MSSPASAETRDAVVLMCANRDVLKGYLTGIMFQKMSDFGKVLDAQIAAHDATRNKDYDTLKKAILGAYCAPNGTTGLAAAEAMCSYAKAHPPTDGVYGVDRVQKIFETLYPCAN